MKTKYLMIFPVVFIGVFLFTNNASAIALRDLETQYTVFRPLGTYPEIPSKIQSISINKVTNTINKITLSYPTYGSSVTHSFLIGSNTKFYTAIGQAINPGHHEDAYCPTSLHDATISSLTNGKLVKVFSPKDNTNTAVAIITPGNWKLCELFGTVTSLTSIQHIKTGQAQTFSANAYGGSHYYTYIWRFGDGAAVSHNSFNDKAGTPYFISDTASHSYKYAGTYSPILNLKDSNGGNVFIKMPSVVVASSSVAVLENSVGLLANMFSAIAGIFHFK